MLPTTIRPETVGQQVESCFESNALILMYHRVTEIVSDPWSLCVTPQHFDEHLQIVRTQACSLQRLNAALCNGNLRHRSIIITFDDGYADNLHHAKPLLEHWDIPATVFLVTESTGSKREFWWDELEGLLLQPGTLPELLRLDINGSSYQWELGNAAQYRTITAQSHGGWRAGDGGDAPSFRHVLYRTLWELLRPLPEKEREEVLDELAAWAGAKPRARPTHRTLSLEELASLASGELIEIGAHSLTHRNLATLPVTLQQVEIRRSKTFLEEIVGRTVTSFAYPFGCYTAETVSLVREAGLTCACSTIADVVRQGTDCFQLPRIHVQDWNGEEFAKQLSMWIEI